MMRSILTNTRIFNIQLVSIVLILMCIQSGGSFASGLVSNQAPLTVMTYNIRVGAGTVDWGKSPYKIKDQLKLDVKPVASAILSVDPDIVGLQEVYGKSQAEQLGRLLNMQSSYVAHGAGRNGGWWGVALLSKHPIIDVQRHQVSHGWGNAKSILVATLEVNNKPVVVIVMHKDRDLKDGKSFRKMLAATQSKSDYPMLLLGDLNIRPDDPRHKILSTVFTDTAMMVNTTQARFVKQRGTVIGPAGKVRGLRIDYVLVSKNFDVIDVGLIPKKHWGASDHLAYFVKLKLN